MGSALAAGDPLGREWDLVVIVAYDRDLVIRAAEPLLRRLVPES
jgi:hypothetical protein